MKFTAPAPLLRMDPITVQRESATVDAEGDAVGGRTTVLSDYGSLVAVSEAESMVASQRGTRIDKALLFGTALDIRAGDFITVNAVAYEVVEVDTRRLLKRAVLRIVG